MSGVEGLGLRVCGSEESAQRAGLRVFGTAAVSLPYNSP